MAGFRMLCRHGISSRVSAWYQMAFEAVMIRVDSKATMLHHDAINTRCGARIILLVMQGCRVPDNAELHGVVPCTAVSHSFAAT